MWERMLGEGAVAEGSMGPFHISQSLVFRQYHLIVPYVPLCLFLSLYCKSLDPVVTGEFRPFHAPMVRLHTCPPFLLSV